MHESDSSEKGSISRLISILEGHSTQFCGPRPAWNQLEKQKFEQAVKMFGRDFTKIAEHLGTRNSVQVKCFAHNLVARLKKDPAQVDSELVRILESNVQQWTKEEDERLAYALETHGRNFEKICQLVSTKSKKQI